MKQKLLVGLMSVVVAANVFLLWQNTRLRKTLNQYIDVLPTIDGYISDFRGLYTYPGIGKYLVQPDTSSGASRSTFSLAIFMAASQRCSMAMQEIELFKRLLPTYQERGQAVVAVVTPADSPLIAAYLDSAGLAIPVVAIESEQFSFTQMGISPSFTPFKVLFDSSYTAVYIRGADNTPESQAVFEQAALWLSEQFAPTKGT